MSELTEKKTLKKLETSELDQSNMPDLTKFKSAAIPITSIEEESKTSAKDRDQFGDKQMFESFKNSEKNSPRGMSAFKKASK